MTLFAFELNPKKTMKTQKLNLIFFTIMIVLNACSIEKKHASFGYHIEWRNNKFLEGNKAIDDYFINGFL
jgi:hypothetical protein